MVNEASTRGDAKRPTIVAPASGRGRAAIAVIRISGPETAQVVYGLTGQLPEPRRAVLAQLRHPETGVLLDQGLVLWFPGPASFSGEDMAELHVHGGRSVVEAVLSAALTRPDIRLAEPGEFSRRALENGKLDLTRIEGLADLINAETEAQRRQALAQAEGVLASLYEGWRARLLRALALIEAELDFSDERDVGGVGGEAEKAVGRLTEEIAQHLDDARRGERLRDGYRIVIAGPPNAGKSSLLNALARRDAAIVSDEPGTTRDLIEVHLDLGGQPVIVTDTAGLREAAAGAVEVEGMRRTVRRAEDADLMLWIIDATDPSVDPPAGLSDPGRLARVLNKIDLPHARALHDAADVAVSAVTGIGMDALGALLARRASRVFGDGDQAPAPTRARHRAELEAAQAAFARFLADPEAPAELKAEDLRLAATRLGRLTGRIDVEDVLGAIFAEFCIGK